MRTSLIRALAVIAAVGALGCYPSRIESIEDFDTATTIHAPGVSFAGVGTYGIPDPVTTFLVRNVLLVPAGMPDALAEALVSVLFGEQVALARASAAALRIDTRAAIGTQPVPLHPGAERFYRAAKTG